MSAGRRTSKIAPQQAAMPPARSPPTRRTGTGTTPAGKAKILNASLAPAGVRGPPSAAQFLLSVEARETVNPFREQVCIAIARKLGSTLTDFRYQCYGCHLVLLGRQ